MKRVSCLPDRSPLSVGVSFELLLPMKPSYRADRSRSQYRRCPRTSHIADVVELTVVIDPVTPLVEVICTGLVGNILEDIDIDAVVLWHGHVSDGASIRIDAAELDVTPRSINDVKAVPVKNLYDLSAGKISRRRSHAGLLLHERGEWPITILIGIDTQLL